MTPSFLCRVVGAVLLGSVLLACSGSDPGEVTSESGGTTGIGDAPSCIQWDLLTADAVRSWVSQLSGGTPITVDGTTSTLADRNSTTSRELVRHALDAEFTRLGYASNVTNYGSGANVVATKGDAKKFVIVSAHYDTPAGVPGADDDASGVAAMLVVAQALAKCSFVRQLRFVAFDEEELGSIGSTAYVEALRHNGELSNLVGVLNLEMLGYDTNSDGGFLLVDCENTTGDHSANTSLVASVDQVIKDLALDLDYQKVCTTGADHDPFWQAARAAITISEEFFFSGADENTCYHQSCDRVGLLNAAYMEKMTTLATGVAVQLAGVP